GTPVLIRLMPWALSQDKNKRGGNMGPCAAKQSRQQARLPDRQLRSAGHWQTRETKPKAWGCAGLLQSASSPKRGSDIPSGPVFLPLSGIVTACCLMASGRLITAGATVTRTGPPSPHVSEGDLRLLDKVSGCYRGTRGEMPQGWLVKGNDLSPWGQSRCSSQR